MESIIVSNKKKRWKSWTNSGESVLEFFKIFETSKHENSRGGKSTMYEILKKYENMRLKGVFGVFKQKFHLYFDW